MDERPQDTGGPWVEFHYIKSNYFRVVHVDGAQGAVTPSLQIQMALFSERLPIPQRTVHELDDDGRLKTSAFESSGKSGVVREVEVEAIMSIATAKSLVDWLQDRISQAEALVTARKVGS